MIKLDHDTLTAAWLHRRREQFGKDPALATARRIGCAVHSPADWLALVAFCRAAQIGCAPLHPGLPRAQIGAQLRALECDAWLDGHTGCRLAHSGPRDPAPGLVQMTSGTTGAARAVVRSWADIDIELAAYNRALLSGGAVTSVVTAPVHHAYGLIAGVLAGLARESVPHVLTGQNPKVVAGAVANACAPLLYSSPVYLEALAHLWPPGAAWPAVMTSGSPLPQPWYETLRARGPVWQQYGCSELGAIALTARATAATHLGRPLDHLEVTAGAELAPADIVVRLKAGGAAVVTGDVGYAWGEDLHFVARTDDTIVNAGQNVYPLAVEAALAEVPGVTELVVLGLPDPRAGTRVGVIYAGPAEVAPATWRRHCEAQLPRYQWPTRFRHVHRIERLPGGKLSRRALARQWLACEPSAAVREGAA